MSVDEADFSDFVRANSPGLLRAAWLLTGDKASAEDLVQAALAHTWVRWAQVRSKDAALAYTRRVMVRTFLRWRRRRWTGEISVEVVPDRVDHDASVGWSDERRVLLDALRLLPRGQRTVVVLRYFNDLSEKATAEAMGCSVGTVKSQSARALRSLRAMPGLASLVTGENV